MNKYRNIKCEYDGLKFDSKLERDRYIELKDNPNVRELQLQVPFELIPKNDLYRAVKYIADFVYMSGDSKVVEDAKAVETKEFILKKKMFYDRYKIPIQLFKRRKTK